MSRIRIGPGWAATSLPGPFIVRSGEGAVEARGAFELELATETTAVVVPDAVQLAAWLRAGHVAWLSAVIATGPAEPLRRALDLHAALRPLASSGDAAGDEAYLARFGGSLPPLHFGGDVLCVELRPLEEGLFGLAVTVEREGLLARLDAAVRALRGGADDVEDYVRRARLRLGA